MTVLKKLNLLDKNFGASNGSDFWSTSSTDGEIVSYNPANGEEIARVYNGSMQDYERLVQEAEKTFWTWRQIPAPKRGEMIHALGEALRENKEALGTLVSQEVGKSKQEGLGEVQEMIDMADFAVGQSRMLYGCTMPSERPEHRLFEQWHPLGVTAVITAFNFPVAVWAWNAFLAAICGNPVIWKPSPKAPLSALAVQWLCNQVQKEFGFSGVFSLFITDKVEIVKNMAADRRIPLVSFTGSTQVGREVNEWVAKRLGRSLLELSGNNAIIVDESANLKLAVPAIVFGAVGTSGQRCTSTRRLIIHESIYAKLVKALTKAYSKVSIGDPLDPKNLMGPLIDKVAVEHFVKAIEKIKKAGGKILFGGEVLDQPGYYVQPTLVEADNNWEIVQQETFAPILYLFSYKTIEEAIAIQNHSNFGLSSALFTNRIQDAELFISPTGSDCGIANINIGTSGAEIGGAFGGEKATGGGREAGSDSWKAYMRRQTNTINWGKSLPLAQGIVFDLGEV